MDKDYIYMSKLVIDFNKIDDIEFDMLGCREYPDFSDAYIISCDVYDEKLSKYRQATDKELDIINDDRSFVYERLMEGIF